MGEARRPPRRRTVVVASGAVAIVAAAGVTLWMVGASASTGGYRTAVAGHETVRQTLGTSGNVEPVDQASADFQVAGTVSTVAVTVGQHVSAGQKLASLDTTTLQDDVASARSTLSAGRAELVENEADEASSTGASSTSGAAGSGTASDSGAATSALVSPSPAGSTSSVVEDAVITTTAPSGRPTGSSAGKGTTATSGTGSLTADQRAVVDAQATVDAEAGTSSALLAQAQEACPAGSAPRTTSPGAGRSTAANATTTPPSATISPTTASPTPSTTSPTSTTLPTTTTTMPTTSTTMPTTTTTVPSGGGSSACTAALARALAAERQLASDEQTLSTVEGNLARALSGQESATATSTGGKTGTSRTATSDGTPSESTGTRTTTGGGSATTTTGAAADSAEQLAHDQSAIDDDQAALIEATQSLAEAQLTSPIAGTVASVGLSSGQSVTAGSSTSAITVLNAGSFDATASLTSTQAAEVKVGDKVSVAVDGLSATLTGTVSDIGPVDTSGSSYTYPLTVALPTGSHGIASGSAAQLQIVLHVVDLTLAVPTSAVHTTGQGDAYVLVLRSGRETRTRVTVGVVGSIYTQLTAGLGDRAVVVLADPSEAIPTSGSNAATGRFGTGGAAGGFGGGAGGFGGGAGGAGPTGA